MRILLAGGTGVLGRAAVPRLVAAGHDVLAVSRRPDSDRALAAAAATPLRLDLFDPPAVRRAAVGSDAVVNLATRIPPVPRALWVRAWRDNDRLRRDASRVLADAAVDAGARLVQESFAATYAARGAAWITEDEPLAPAAQTRTVPAAEASAGAVTRAGGTGVVLRFGIFYGAGIPDLPRWLNAARSGRLLLPGPPGRYVSMVLVDDAAAAVVAALDLPAGRYNVVEDEPLTVGEHAAVLGGLIGRERVRPLPRAAGWIGALRVLARSQRISNARLRAASGWRPQAPSVREGWKRVLEEVATGGDRERA